ncbi:flavodoxin domain-containing protein [Methanobrevibacter sp.]
MNIAIIYSTNNKSTKKSCKILSEKIKADVKLIPIDKAKNECILKYNFIILAGSALLGRVQSSLKIFISNNLKTLKEKPLGLIINCEEDKDRFYKTFSEELVDSSYICSNFGFEITDDGNYIEKRLVKKLIDKYKKDNNSIPTLNINEINNFANTINEMIEKRVD